MDFLARSTERQVQKMRVLLILVDGMRPDAITHIPQAQQVIRQSASTMCATTVMPSMTLPCHMSLFHSVDPSRHGTTTNTYAPQVRPVDGLCEVLHAHDKTIAFFHNWDYFRDLARPGVVDFVYYQEGAKIGYSEADRRVVNFAMGYLKEHLPDFAFLYFGNADEEGHRYGWMGDAYLSAIRESWEHIERVLAELPDEYTVFFMADHGGHDRIHGTPCAEDMTIPVMIRGKDFPAGSVLENVHILDIAPTIAHLLGVPANRDWEGRNLLG